jgi:hypothetical protein
MTGLLYWVIMALILYTIVIFQLLIALEKSLKIGKSLIVVEYFGI